MNQASNAINIPNTVEAPKLIAHRGLAVGVPENSLQSFIMAGEARFWAIETDIHETKDGILVCNHDATVDRMYTCSGLISGMTYDELMTLTICHEEHDATPVEMLKMPTFRQYLEICKRYGALPFIEVKSGSLAKIIEQAGAYFSTDQIIISSTNQAMLYEARKVSNEVFLHHIFSKRSMMLQLSELGNCGVSYNYPDYRDCPIDLRKETRGAGVLLCLRAGDKPEIVRNMVDFELDYIPTNCVTPADVYASLGKD